MSIKNKNKKIWALVPIKATSKSIKKKNFIKIQNKELFRYTFDTLKKSNYINKVFVTTDSNYISEIAKNEYGFECPYLRPKKISKDKSNDKEYVFHFLDYLNKIKSFLPNIIIQLRPTTPFRNHTIIKAAIKKLESNKICTSLRSVENFSHPIEKVFKIKNNFYVNYKGNQISNESFNRPRQAFKKVYKPNGYVDILKISHLIKKKDIYGNKILSFITPKTIEIDDIDDFKMVQNLDKKFFRKFK